MKQLETVHTLLLIDDDEATRRSIQMMLGRSGKRIIETADGATALDLFKANAINLLITDIERPGMDGVALIRAVREINPG